MILAQPIWLLLAIPLAAALWLWRPPGRVLLAMRIAAMVLLILAACGAAVILPSRAGTLVIVVDRSASMNCTEASSVARSPTCGTLGFR